MDARPSIRETFGRWIMGDSVGRAERRLVETADLLFEAYQRGPALLPFDEMETRLQELDPRLVDLLTQQLTSYQLIYSSATSDDKQIRGRVVQESRSLFEWDVTAKQIIRLWTDYGFGLKTQIIPKDQQAKEVWDEFWSAVRNNAVLNEREIQNLSYKLLTDGEFYIVLFIAKVDGTATIRIIPTDEITRVITRPDDKSTVVFYERQYTDTEGTKTVYYQDWRATEDDVIEGKKSKDIETGGTVTYATDQKEGTSVIMIQVAHEKQGHRGWPLLKAGTEWVRSRSKFVKDRAAVMASRAANVEKITAKNAGQRAIDQIRQNIESSLARSDNQFNTERNPAPTAGSVWIQNDQLDRIRQDLSTGASDAEKDASLLTGMAGLSGSIFPHYLGMGEAFRLATATAMEGPMLRAFQRYQNFWSSVWRDLVKAVLTANQGVKGSTFTSLEADINSDAILQVDLGELSSLMESVDKLAADGVLDPTSAANATATLVRMALSVLGVSEIDALVPMPELAAEFARLRPATLGEKAGFDEFWSGIKSYVTGLWNGSFSEFQFVDGMVSLIERRLKQGWYEGAASCGISPDDLTEKEKTALTDMINHEYQFIVGFARAIQEESKANGGTLAGLLKRGELWLNRYNEARNRGAILACADKKKKWVYTEGKAHCDSCKKLNGKVKRASFWEASGVIPQSPPNSKLVCEGWECGCKFEDTTDPISKGPLPNLP